MTQKELEDFLHDFLVGISGLPNELVRPDWQLYPGVFPGNKVGIPDFEVDWLAFGIKNKRSDFSPVQELKSNGSYEMQRNEYLDLFCVFYGLNSQITAENVRDNLFINQNSEVLNRNGFAFVKVDEIIDASMIFNNRFYRRADLTITIGRLLKKTYEILPFLKAEGDVIGNIGEKTITSNWEVQ